MKALATLLALAFLVGSAQSAPNSARRVRVFAQLPDWSGLWEQFDVGVSGLPNSDADAAASLKEWADQPPYNKVWQEKYEAAIRAQSAQPEPVICTFGFPTLMLWSPLMFQAVVAPEETTLMFSQRETRHIPTDGSAHPAADALWPMPWGNSVGHWDGQTLVVDTVATSSPLVRFVHWNGGFLRVFAPLSEQLHVTERIRMINANTLENQLVIDDPVAFSHPWRLTRQYHRVQSMKHLVDEDCLGHERNPVVDGNYVIAPH